MTTQIKITQLVDIGANLATTTVLPVVNMSGVPTTQKTNLGNLGNVILQGAGTTWKPAALANLAYSVANAAQPNITSVGTLTELTVSGNVDLGDVSTLSIGGGSDGYVLQTNGVGALSWAPQTGGSGNTGDLSFVGNAMYNLGGVIIENADLSHDATAAILVPANGGGNLQVNNTYGNVLIQTGVNDTGFTGQWTFDNSGTINTTTLLPRAFTAVLNSQHSTSPITLTGTPWQFDIQFQVDPNGLVETISNNIFPILDNPGYTSGDAFTFTEADHNIPGYILTITLNNVVLPGGAGWTANPSFSIPPTYPSTLNSDGAIKLTSNGNDWIFGTTGFLTLPSGAKITTTGTSVDLVAGPGGWAELASNNGDNYVWVDDDGAYIATGALGQFKQWTFGEDGSTTFGSNAKLTGNPNEFTLDSPTVEIINLVDNTGTGFYTDTYQFKIQANAAYTWSFDNTGNLRVPAGDTQIKSFNAPGSSISLGWENYGNANINSRFTANADGAYVGIVNNAGDNYQWQFDTTGNLTLPDIANPSINYANGTAIFGNIAAINLDGNVANVLAGDGSWIPAGGGGNASLPLYNGTSQFNIPVSDGNITITANSSHTWTFGDNGTLYFPDNSGQGWPINQQRYGMGNIGAWLDGQWTIGEFNANVSGATGIRIDPAIEGPVGMTFPGTADAATQPVQIYSTAGSGIQMYTGSNNWTFGSDGNFILPGNTFSVNYANGSPVQLGSAALGNLTVDNITLQGVSGYSGGLQLSASPDDTANLKYLQIRSGDFDSHIHFDTGNNQAYDQYFGDDNKYLKLEAGLAGNVLIGTYQDGGIGQIHWTYDSNGNLILPENGRIKAAGNVLPFITTITNITTGNPTVVVTLTDNVFNDQYSGQITISNVTGTTEANNTWWYLAATDNSLQLYYDQALTAPVDGTSWTAYVSGGDAVSVGSALSILASNVTIDNGLGKTWLFDSTGNLTLAGNARAGGLNGGRYIQDCTDGTTSMRWYNMGTLSQQQLIRAYTGDELTNDLIERGSISIDYSGTDNVYSGLTLTAFDNTANLEIQTDWRFNGDGSFQKPNSVYETTSNNVTCNPGGPTVILSSINSNIHTIKLIIQVEGVETSVNYDTQSCEMLVVRSYRNNSVVGSVYGLTYTSNSPLATFNAAYNNTTNQIDVTCTPTSGINPVFVRLVVTQMVSAD